tara:strand:- start:110 stop:805 length:696 start_codon:yes stop_codon:yes gene_type:complete
MPKKTITAPGTTKGVNILKSNTNYNTAHDATAGTNAGNGDTKFTIHGKAGSNYLIRRGILLYDFRPTIFPGTISIVKAQLILNDITENAAQTGGDKIRVAWMSNPNTFGATHANDYNKTRYDAATYTSAQQLANGADGEIINLDNRKLLKQIQKAFNQKTFLHLVVRNELDYQDTTSTGNNRTFFDRPNADNNPLQMRIFFRTFSSYASMGKAGFGGTDISPPNGVGFGSF